MARRGSAGVAGGGGPGLSRNPLRATNFPGQRGITRGGGRDFSPLLPAAVRRDPVPRCQRPASRGRGCLSGGRQLWLPRAAGKRSCGETWAVVGREAAAWNKSVGPRWHRGGQLPCPVVVSRASWQTKCPSICCQTLKWSDKPAMRTQAGEKSSQSGVEARHSMEQSYRKAARFEVWAPDAAVPWVHCKESILRW